MQINQTIAKAGRYRWPTVALVFFATTVNYFARTVIDLLAPSLEKELNWGAKDYGNIASAFQLA